MVNEEANWRSPGPFSGRDKKKFKKCQKDLKSHNNYRPTHSSRMTNKQELDHEIDGRTKGCG